MKHLKVFPKHQPNFNTQCEVLIELRTFSKRGGGANQNGKRKRLFKTSNAIDEHHLWQSIDKKFNVIKLPLNAIFWMKR